MVCYNLTSVFILCHGQGVKCVIVGMVDNNYSGKIALNKKKIVNK